MGNLLLKFKASKGKLSFGDFKRLCTLYENTEKDVYQRIIRSFFKNCHLGKEKYDYFSVFTPKIWKEYVASYVNDKIKIDDDIWLKMDIRLWTKVFFHFEDERKIICCSDAMKRDYYLRDIQLSNNGVSYLFDTYLKEKSGEVILSYFCTSYRFLFLNKELKETFVKTRSDLFLKMVLTHFEGNLLPLEFARLLPLINNLEIVRTILCKTIVNAEAFNEGLIIQKHRCYAEAAISWIMCILYYQINDDNVKYPLPEIRLRNNERLFLEHTLKQGEGRSVCASIRNFLETKNVSIKFYAEIIYHHPEMRETVLMDMKSYFISQKCKKMPASLKQRLIMIIDYALLEMENK